MFSPLADEHLQKLFDNTRFRKAAQGKLIFRRGVGIEHFHFLLSGDIELIGSQFHSERLHASNERCREPLCEAAVTTVSAVAKSPVIYAEIERHLVERVMSSHKSREEEDSQGEDWMSILLDSPLFRHIPPATIQQLFATFEAVDVAQGKVIVKEGARGDYFYVLAHGSAEVSLPGGRRVALRAGQYFGEEALLADAFRNATVVMTRKGRLMRLAKPDFKELLQAPLLRMITVEELETLKSKENTLLLDVRLSSEHQRRTVPGSRNLPLQGLRQEAETLCPSLTYVITDDGGRRAEVAAHLLQQLGLNAVVLQDSARLYG